MRKIKYLIFLYLLLSGAGAVFAQENPSELTEFTDDIVYSEPVDFGDEPGPQALEIAITLWGGDEDDQVVELTIEKTPSFITNPIWSEGSRVSFKAEEFEKIATLAFDLGAGPRRAKGEGDSENVKRGREEVESEELVIVLRASSEEIMPAERRIVLPIKTPPPAESDEEILGEGIDPSVGGDLPKSIAPPILYLSSIKGPKPFSKSLGSVEFEENVPRFLNVSKTTKAGFSNDRRTTSQSFVLTEFPKEIHLGDDFVIAAEKRTQIEEKSGYCGQDAEGEGKGLMARYFTSVDSVIYFSRARTAKIKTFKESPNDVPCEIRGEKTKIHPGFKVGDALSIRVSCVFNNVDSENNSDFSYKYLCSAGTNGEILVYSDTLEFDYSKTHGGITGAASFGLGGTPSLWLEYKGKNSGQGEGATKNYQLSETEKSGTKFGIGVHYFEIVNDIGSFEKVSPADGGTGSDGADVVGEGTETGVPGSRDFNGSSRDPSALDPKRPEIAALINQWLSIAEPPKNAEGARFRYNKWGSWEGRGASGKTVRVGRPDAAAGMTSEAYVWSIRAERDSIDHCMLEEYVMAQLANESISHCRGRYRMSQGIAVASVVGLPGAKAKRILEDTGLKVNLLMGRPAATEGQAFTVMRQDHAPSKRVAPGTVVQLTVYDEFKSLVQLPSVAGLPSTAARNQLVAAGFTVEVNPVGKPGKAKDAFTVKDTTPLANAAVARGSLVVLNTYGSFDDSIVMPRVIGIDRFDALRELESMGINADTGVDIEAPSKDLVGIVYKQAPVQGVKVSPRTNVELTYYGQHVWRGTMPNLVGLTKSQVSSRLANMGLSVTSTLGGTAPSNKTSQSVSSQSISPGTEVKEGQSVQLVYYRKSQQQQVADLNCSVPNSVAFWNGANNAPGCKCSSGYSSASDGKSCQREAEGPIETPVVDKPEMSTPEMSTPRGNLACLCKAGDAYNRNDKTCDSPYSQASVFGGKSDTAYPSGSYPFTNECSYPIRSSAATSGSKKLPPNAYVIDRIEIPKSSYQTTGSVICDIQVSKNSRVKHCRHHRGEETLKLQIRHDFNLRGASGGTFIPGEKVYLDIKGSISGHSKCCSIGDYVQAGFVPRGGKFETESKTGDGNGFSMTNGDLPFIKRVSVVDNERRGSAAMTATRVATFPDAKGKPVKIVLNGTNGSSLVTYHLKPAK